MKRTVIVLLLCTIVCNSFAQTGNDFGITQNKQGGITITGYTGKIKDVIIPSTIEGIKVTEIGRSAFRGNKNITSVTIPNSIKSIGDEAFKECTSLASITMPDSVTSIGNGAFAYTGLTSVTIPNSIKSIGDEAFEECISLTNIVIPDSVASIGNGAFFSCTSLTNITMPNSVTSIGNASFAYTGLTSITIPNSVKIIGDNAFARCTDLISVTIPNSVTIIGNGAFSGCSYITIITVTANKDYSVAYFPNNFASYYESQGKKAGSYLFSGRIWKIVPTNEIEQAKKEAVAIAEQAKKEIEFIKYFNKGVDAYNQEDYDGAIASFTQAILLNPNYSKAYEYRSEIYFFKKNWESAIKDADEVIRLDPNNHSAYDTRGRAYYMKKDYNSAIADFEQALQLDPNNAGYKKTLEIAKKELEKTQKVQEKKKK